MQGVATKQDRGPASNELHAAESGTTSESYGKTAKDAFMAGNRFLAADEHGKAVAAYTEAVRLDSKLAYAFYGRGLAHGKLGKSDEAIGDFTAAIQLGAQTSACLPRRGEAYLRRGTIETALVDFNVAIQLAPASASAYLDRGQAFDAKKDLDKALADYSQAIALDAKPSWAASRVVDYERKGDYEKSLADHSEIVRLEPGKSDGYMWGAHSTT